MPREPARIRKFCNQFAALWELVPDMRFGQFTLVVFDFLREHGLDPFYVEDDEMIRKFKEYMKC